LHCVIFGKRIAVEEIANPSLGATHS
jgi:hypothetical protein